MQTEPTTTMDTSPAAPFAGNGIAVDRRQRTRSSTPPPIPYVLPPLWTRLHIERDTRPIIPSHD